MSVSELTSKNLTVAINLIHKNGAIIKDCQSHSQSIVALNEQWRNLLNSFETVHYSLENRVRELESKERELTLIKNQIENYQKEVELWQKKLEFEEKSLSLRIKRVEIREKQVKDRIKAVMERQRMVGEKEKESKAVSEAMDCSEKILKEFANNLELKGGELSKLFLVLEKEKKVLELRKEELYNVVDLKENKMKKAMEIKEQEISKLREALSLLSKKMMLKEKQMNEYYQREKRSDGNLMLSRCRDQESIKKQNVDSSSSKIGHDIHSLCKHMDADGVRSYLIKHFKEQSILQEKVLDAIRFAPNPGKLVLDVCQSFHQKYSDKGELVKNQSSCTFLLEQFRKLSAPIRHDVEDDAIYFADSMKDWLKGYTTPADIFEFLQFLAAFKLAGRYNADELLSLLGCLYGGGEVYQHEKQASLCGALGLLEKIPGVVKSLIKGKKLLLAVKYICVFKLECKFLPVPLLESHLHLSMKRVNEKCNDGNLKSKIQADLQELDILREVTTCIATFKLQSKFPPGILLQRIKELEKQISKRRKSADAFTSLKKRSASVASPKQLQKRPRLGNV